VDVLIVERDELMRDLLVDTLDPDSLNRSHNEDMTGLRVVAAMRHKWQRLCAVYLASLWPVHLRREMLAAGVPTQSLIAWGDCGARCGPGLEVSTSISLRLLPVGPTG
jgi:hypothetical protein